MAKLTNFHHEGIKKAQNHLCGIFSTFQIKFGKVGAWFQNNLASKYIVTYSVEPNYLGLDYALKSVFCV